MVMEKISREPKITEVPLTSEERAKIGWTLSSFILMAFVFISVFTYKTHDYLITILLTGVLGVGAYFIGKEYILDFIFPTKQIIEGKITWKREYSRVKPTSPRYPLSEEYVWHYWIYLGSMKLEVNESEFKKYNEGDFLRVEKAKRSNIIYSIHLLKKKEEQ